MNYNETLSYIHSLNKFGSVLGLERITKLLDKLGNPEKELKFIHVAGTNGKGSTCTMLSSVYIDAGLKTGLYTSPYVIDFRERIQVNGKFIEKECLTVLSDKIKETGVVVTEFEFITALAFLYFKEQKCDIVILEVGMGGRFDATNAIENPLCSVITRIDLDHTDYLGDTIEKIAFEKCGIIKKGSPTISYPIQEYGSLTTIQNRSEKLIVPDINSLRILSSDINGNRFIYKDTEYYTRLVGKHQIYNALTVIETVREVGLADSQNIKLGIANAVLPARIELISSSPDVVLDGSHNPDGAHALSEFMKNYNNDIVIIVGMMKDKDCEMFLKRILPYCSSAVTVEVKENIRSISAQELKSLALKYCSDVISANSYEEAIEFAKSKSEEKKPIFVCGSLYLASAIREKLIYNFK